MRVARIFCFAFPILLMIPFAVIATETPAIDPANMDLRVKPGGDFYQFANGGWVQRKPLPPEHRGRGSVPGVLRRHDTTRRPILEGSGAHVKKGETVGPTGRQVVRPR